jgi:hypothetical protein
MSPWYYNGWNGWDNYNLTWLMWFFLFLLQFGPVFLVMLWSEKKKVPGSIEDAFCWTWGVSGLSVLQSEDSRSREPTVLEQVGCHFCSQQSHLVSSWGWGGKEWIQQKQGVGLTFWEEGSCGDQGSVHTEGDDGRIKGTGPVSWTYGLCKHTGYTLIRIKFLV